MSIEPIWGMSVHMSDRLAKLAFIVSTCFLVALAIFACGLAVGHYKVWPFKMIKTGQDIAVSYLKYGEFIPENRRHIAPRRCPSCALRNLRAPAASRRPLRVPGLGPETGELMLPGSTTPTATACILGS